MKLRKVLAFCMTLCLVAVRLPFTAMGADSASASVMRMAGTEGNVSVSTENGRSLTVREDMKLYSGYTLNTELASYAYVSLDGTKAVKMDALSEVSVRKSGRELELLLNSGKLFFDVTAPLEQDETLNIRTSTMVTGIRGTAGVVELGEQVSSIYLLDGEVELLARDPVSGEVRGVKVQAGQKATIVTGEDANGREYTRVFVTDLTEEEIDGFAAKEILEDAALQERIRDASGLDVEQIIMGANDKLIKEQEEAARLMEERRNRQKTDEENESDSVDPVFSGEDGVDPENMQEGGQGNEGGGPGVTDPAGPAGSSSGGGSSESSSGSGGPGESSSGGGSSESESESESSGGSGGPGESSSGGGSSESSSESEGPSEPTTESGGATEPTSGGGGTTEPTTESRPSESSSESGSETEPTTESGPSESSSESGGETEPTTGGSEIIDITLDIITSGEWKGKLVTALATKDEVILGPESPGASGTDLPLAIISEDLIIPPGKTLKVNIPAGVAPGKTMTVEGTMNVTTGFINEGTIVNKGMNTFVIEKNAFFTNTGIFQNKGRLVNNGKFETMEGEINPEFSNTGTIENYGKFEPVKWESINDTDVQIGSFVNQGNVKNFGSISISYLNGSTPGDAAKWEWGEGGRLFLNYLHEYNNGYQTQFDSLCEVIGQESVRALGGEDNGPEGTRQVVVARDFQTILKQDFFTDFEMMESVLVSGDLTIEETRNVSLYLNNKTLTMDGGSIINNGYLEIYGGSLKDNGNGQGFVHGINTDRVIVNNGIGNSYGVNMKNVDVELKSSAGGPGSCAFENKGRVQLIGEAGQAITCRFINNEDEGWGFYNNTERGATVHSGEANVAVEFQALTPGYTANLDDTTYPEVENGQGVIRRVELNPQTELIFEISEASPSNASYFLEWPPAISTDANATPLPWTDDTHSTGAGGNQIATDSNADWESAEHNNAEAQAGGQQDEASSKNQASGSLNNLIWKEEEQDEKK